MDHFAGLDVSVARTGYFPSFAPLVVKAKSAELVSSTLIPRRQGGSWRAIQALWLASLFSSFIPAAVSLAMLCRNERKSSLRASM